MLESTPGKPWSINPKDLLDVEDNMRWRREIATKHMCPNEFPITMTTFPRLGTRDDYIKPYYPPSGPMMRSQFVPDEIANPHIRFPTLAANIRSRRGRKVEINVPIFKDEKTPVPFKDPTVDYDLNKYPEDADVRNGATLDDHVYMDAMAYGMGSCCLQITFQAKNINEGRKLYDQLSPLGPIMLAMTAATSIYKGFLVDTDARWNQICRSVDDRTPEELGKVPLKDSRWRIPKSRYAANSTYISEDPPPRPEYLDPDLVFDPELKQQLVDGGMDDLLATHFAHLFIRDPLVIFSEDLQTLDEHGSNHFENLQSTNWQHMRFKPPPPDADIGWRVEFRSMEIQMTDFENAAFSIFLVLITRAILSYDLNLLIPIPRTTENMETAHVRESITKSRFWFRKDPLPHHHRGHRLNGIPFTPYSSNPASGAATPQSGSCPGTPPLCPIEDEYALMTIDEIINGCPAQRQRTPNFPSQPAPTIPTSSPAPRTASSSNFPGLLPLVETYLASLDLSIQTQCQLAVYLNFIRRRAAGEIPTNASWIRDFVRSRKEYKGDSVVSEEITWALLSEIRDRGDKGEWVGKSGANADEAGQRPLRTI